MKFKNILLIIFCIFGSVNLAISQKFLEATVIKNDGTELRGLVHENLIKYGKKCIFKKSHASEKESYSPDIIQAVKFRNHYVETKRLKRFLPDIGQTFEALFLIKILDGEVDLFEKGTIYKEKGHYILKNERLIHIQPWYDKMPAHRTKTFKRNKTTLKTLFEDCNETNNIVEKEKNRFSREDLINLIFAYNKCKGAKQNILSH